MAKARVPNSGVSYLHTSEMDALGLTEEYMVALVRREAERKGRKQDEPDNALMKKESKNVAKRID